MILVWFMKGLEAHKKLFKKTRNYIRSINNVIGDLTEATPDGQVFCDRQ